MNVLSRFYTILVLLAHVSHCGDEEGRTVPAPMAFSPSHIYIPDVSTAASPPDASTPITLDLVDPNMAAVELEIDGMASFSCKFYRVKEGFSISKVVHQGRTVWDSHDGYTCTFVQLYTRGNGSLISLWLENEHTFYTSYYERMDGGWRTIGLLQFDAALRGMLGGQVAP